MHPLLIQWFRREFDLPENNALEILKNCIELNRLINKYIPEKNIQINITNSIFLIRENIFYFLETCRELKIPNYEIPSTDDVYFLKNEKMFENILFSFAIKIENLSTFEKKKMLLRKKYNFRCENALKANCNPLIHSNMSAQIKYNYYEDTGAFNEEIYKKDRKKN